MPRSPRTCLLLLLGASPPALGAPATEWHEYLGGPERNHYSPLAQIDPGNVGRLRVAWEYHTGEPGEVQCNPLVVDAVLYGVTAVGGIFALDAATGRERWRHAGDELKPGGDWKENHRILRGRTYWAGGADKRILFASGPWLRALDAATGRPVADFGAEGRVSLKQGLGEQARDKWVVSTTPGALYGDLLIMPLRLTEGADAAPGYLQAFNVRTGALVWTFHTIPLPGEFGHDTWSPDAHKNTAVGGANCWAGMAIDRERGIVFVPTGSAAPDFWGGARKGPNLFANCLLALDAFTGRRLWHYQFVHHDLWDRDLPAPPNLVTVRRGGRTVDAVAQVTKSGHVFVFDRVTGEPLFPIEEVPVPRSDLPGEASWPTQPLPVKPAPFARQTLTESDLSPYTENRDAMLARFSAARTGTFQPFGKHDTLLFPGFDGGAEWGGAAVDPDGVLYVNANEMAWMARLKESLRPEELARLSPGGRVYAVHCATCHGSERAANPAAGLPSLVDLGARRPRDEVARLVAAGKGMMPGFSLLSQAERELLVDFLFGTEKEGTGGESAAPVTGPEPPKPAYVLDRGYLKFLDERGYPAIRPPWGSLTAIDLNTGEHRWRITLGNFAELAPDGTPPTGTENYGGPVVTAGGLLFIAATKDSMFRAFDRATGRLLWKTELPAPGFATPCTYEVDGRQFVAVAACGTKLGTKEGDSYVAFALP